MLYIICFLALTTLVSFIVFCRSSNGDGIGTCTLSIMALITTGVIHVPVILCHCHSLATIRSADDLIGVYTESLSDLDKQMESLSKNIDSKTLFNNDSPYRTLIQAKSHYVSELADARLEIVKEKRKIQARKLGLMSHIVRWFGEE
jgi:hypothetical protein